MYSELSLPAFIFGAAIFVSVRSLCGGKETRSRLTETFSECSFGVYLLHVAVLEIFVRFILLYAATLAIPFTVVNLTGKIRGNRKIFFHR